MFLFYNYVIFLFCTFPPKKEEEGGREQTEGMMVEVRALDFIKFHS